MGGANDYGRKHIYTRRAEFSGDDNIPFFLVVEISMKQLHPTRSDEHATLAFILFLQRFSKVDPYSLSNTRGIHLVFPINLIKLKLINLVYIKP
jgi:hypothetical protein